MTAHDTYYRSHNELLDLPMDEIQKLYESGLSMRRIAQRFSVHTMTIHKHMRLHGIKSRKKGTSGHLWGKHHQNWKGDDAGYGSLHERLNNRFGTPKKCEQCGTTDSKKTYEWANLTGNYRDIADYKRMCRSCHKKFDHQRRKHGDNRHGGATKPLPEVR